MKQIQGSSKLQSLLSLLIKRILKTKDAVRCPLSPFCMILVHLEMNHHSSCPLQLSDDLMAIMLCWFDSIPAWWLKNNKKQIRCKPRLMTKEKVTTISQSIKYFIRIGWNSKYRSSTEKIRISRLVPGKIQRTQVSQWPGVSSLVFYYTWWTLWLQTFRFRLRYQIGKYSGVFSYCSSAE